MPYRFAPSPTGKIHLGNARIALLNYKLAEKYNDQFILRIDDTDQSRNIDSSSTQIIDDLKFLNINAHQKYYQSARQEIYREIMEKIYDFEDETGYFITTHENTIKWHDTCFKEQKIQLPLRIKIARPDKTALYNFCSAIDDITMNIKHIIRGNDHIANTGIQIFLMQKINTILNQNNEIPKFTHLPLITDINGKAISKRNCDISIANMRQKYTSNALIDYILQTGHSAENNSDIDKILSHLNTSMIKLDFDKLKIIQRKYISRMKFEDISNIITDIKNTKINPQNYQIITENSANIEEIHHNAKILTNEFRYAVSKEIKMINQKILSILTEENIRNNEWKAKAKSIDKNYMKNIRLSLTGAQKGMPLSQIMNIIGYQEIKNRIEY